jgi:hypothetical protein
MPTVFPKGTKVWPVHRHPNKPQNTWCAKPVELNRMVSINRLAIEVNHNKATTQKFSRFVELNNKYGGRRSRYQIFLFDEPVKQERHLVMGFITKSPT